ncbi:ParB N-terminal domain-containing protein (plasmid) [Prescottella equi]|uniref:ParB N-terminal domain-containing protein n=2 Tax=Rhodococcus hoagii TaxID=43767 RepID=A0A9Q5F3B7_RHOHA|nr:ParB N-terminal domain-containing protein [Prescottella equi]MBM4487710.1 ParB N-terminal domain-containing protein [Prescottella equi]MBM4498428.1 ParB N-terminal domain-containing protein [Prescottella equi]MBM4507692.1 ParB N-terminal domain-containing protein [Prescottella equi]MBM4532435.1 ParB N-terminal domain-containing protein [Prescottella equi]MBM4532467.1 ParB N-terminal domain-containing protein [Prescottella equi]
MTNTESLELVTVDPTTLLVDTNIRADLRLTKGFLQSIAEHGVMTPPTAVRTADGQLRVRTGHRRTAAAVHNGLAAIPVLVIGDEATDDAATLDRLATQWAENEHRTGLDHADKVDTVEQMSLLGVPAGQIAKRLKTTRREVAAAVAVAQNDTARSHLAERDLTLDEAAAFAEFSDDPDAIASLEHAIDTGRLAHVAQSLRDRRAEHAAALEAGSAYAAEGITIYTEHPAYGTGPRALHSLVDADGNEATRETVPTEHLAAYMQGRVAYLDKETGDEIDEDTIDFTAGPDDEPDEGLRHPDTVDINHDGYRPVWYCTDPTAAGLRDRYGRNTNTATADDSDTGKADRAAERRAVIDNNKAWTSAETVRRAWLTDLAARKGAPKGAATFIANSLAARARLFDAYHVHQTRNEILGTTNATDITALIGKASEARAQLLALVQVLAAHEAATGKNDWRTINTDTVTYLRYLESLGYTLSEIELRACGEEVLTD